MKKLLNYSEVLTYDKLKKVCSYHNTKVFAKVRLADIFTIEGSGISDEHYKFALQSHMDFIVVKSDYTRLFAVEFDGPSHKNEKQKIRDRKKIYLSDKFNLPLLRIKSSYLNKQYRGFDLLSWFIETWFAYELLEQAQLDGYIPYDEPIDPTLIYNIPNSNRRYPLWLGLEARVQINQYKELGRCEDGIPSSIIYKDGNDNYKGISYLKIEENKWLCIKTGMLNQKFPGVISELLSDIMACEIAEALKQNDYSKHIIDDEKLNKKCKEIQNKYTRCSFSGLSRGQ